MVKYKIQERAKGSKDDAAWNDSSPTGRTFEKQSSAEAYFSGLKDPLSRFEFRIVEFEYTERVVLTQEQRDRAVVERIQAAIAERKASIKEFDAKREEALNWAELSVARKYGVQISEIKKELTLLEGVLNG